MGGVLTFFLCFLFFFKFSSFFLSCIFLFSFCSFFLSSTRCLVFFFSPCTSFFFSHFVQQRILNFSLPWLPLYFFYLFFDTRYRFFFHLTFTSNAASTRFPLSAFLLLFHVLIFIHLYIYFDEVITPFSLSLSLLQMLYFHAVFHFFSPFFSWVIIFFFF